jgi:aminoglycoside phosphotransferase (APT) family kinase protein
MESNMSTPYIDRTAEVRSGEELDVAKLEAFLIEQVPGSRGPLTVRQFPSGHSNLTYLLTMGDQELVLRRPPFGSKVKTAHDMGREYRIMKALYGSYPVPRPLVHTEDTAVIGAPFYVMERIAGLILRKEMPEGLSLSPDQVRAMGFALIDNLAALHKIDYKAVGLGDLGKPAGYVERQVTGWTKRYHGSKTDDIPAVLQAADWLAAKMPAESGAALIHNDYKYDNVILDPADPTRIIGVLDWEMSTIGDPLMDLGTALGYWVEATDSDEMQMIRFVPTTIPGTPTRRELIARYAELTGADVSYMPYYYVFALFKTAVVAQQIYYRYAQGFTKDPRFAAMIMGVHVLANEAVKAAEESGL